MNRERISTFAVCAVFLAHAALAQQPAVPAQQAAPQAGAEAAAPAGPFTRSFLFSPAEVTAVRRAMAGMATGTSMLGAGKKQQVIPMHRIIAVSGVVWKAEGDWIVWLNGHKVTPKALLPEIVDIRVEREQVHLKWFDIGINGVISISLRPHQTYDIVTGVLLPG